MNYAPVFNTLLGVVDESAKGLILRRLQPRLPATVPEQKAWFTPYLDAVEHKQQAHYRNMAQNLKRTLVFNNGLSPLGLLRSCLDYALSDHTKLGGVFDAVGSGFKVAGGRTLLNMATSVNEFRNTYIAHQEKQLMDVQLVKRHLTSWVEALKAFTTAE